MNELFALGIVAAFVFAGSAGAAAVPPIDAGTHARTETATFALG